MVHQTSVSASRVYCTFNSRESVLISSFAVSFAVPFRDLAFNVLFLIPLTSTTYGYPYQQVYQCAPIVHSKKALPLGKCCTANVALGWFFFWFVHEKF